MDSETLTSSPDADGNGYWASFAMSSFSKGENMNAHEGILIGKGPRTGEKAIVKAFKHQTGTEELCDLEILKCSTAEKLANVFNAKFRRHQRIAFCKPMKALMDRVAFFSFFSLDRKKLSKTEWVLITKNMSKDLHRWISKRGTPCRHISNTMQAFVHFCYDYTGGDLVLCDFKGIEDGLGFELNTPTIHSQDGRFGEFDQGSVGVVKVFDRHTCNDICRNMLVPNLNPRGGFQSVPVDIPVVPSAPYDPCLGWDPSSPMISYPMPIAPPPYELHPTFTFPHSGNSTQVLNSSQAMAYGIGQK
ncbi:alpha-protein kinase vwkA-like [Gigantopelta aegis]|uniref:alpha-protein kinase vwkA-like n=1 Tax=Gigantopelta aegis TaxID=1735272 RepID=UPI001B887C43|nr:alpha-protein kinase vwkA-like [Gigantopelta aegis]